MHEYIVRLEHDADGANHYFRMLDEELVRCGDCKHKGWDMMFREHICVGTGVSVKTDDYCSRGERRNDEAD